MSSFNVVGDFQQEYKEDSTSTCPEVKSSR